MPDLAARVLKTNTMYSSRSWINGRISSGNSSAISFIACVNASDSCKHTLTFQPLYNSLAPVSYIG